MPENCSSEILKQMIDNFERWIERTGYESYDPYDIWGTKYGIFARHVYYNSQLKGLPFVAPILFMDTFFPSLRKLFLTKERFATADAQLLLSFLNLYQISDDEKYLQKSKALADDLLKISIPGYSGYCWGYPFDWQNSGALWKKSTPYITATPYCFEAFLRLYKTTNEKKYLDIALSIVKFVDEDLHDTKTSETASAGSYSPIDNSKVVNASAYRAMVLIEAANITEIEELKNKALRNINFILENQNSDGSWLYGIGDDKSAFIDHFHTCFVLKNLYKANKLLKSDQIKKSIKIGYNYYRKNLFDTDDNPISFAIKPRFQIVKLEMYNFAEAITLGALLKEEIPDSLELANKLAVRLKRHYQLKDGHFISKIYKGGIKQTMPFLRWPQSQLFYSITNLLTVTE